MAEEQFSDLIFYLITKYTLHYCDGPHFQKEWKAQSFMSVVFRELNSAGFDEVDASGIARNLSSAVDIYLQPFKVSVRGPNDMSNPRLNGLRGEDSREITRGFMEEKEFLPDYYKTHLFRTYDLEIQGLLSKIRQEIDARNYLPSSCTLPQRAILGLPPSSR